MGKERFDQASSHPVRLGLPVILRVSDRSAFDGGFYKGVHGSAHGSCVVLDPLGFRLPDPIDPLYQLCFVLSFFQYRCDAGQGLPMTVHVPPTSARVLPG